MAFTTEFIVGQPGAPADGDNIYYNPILAGAKMKIFREGAYQYRQLGTNHVVVPGTGTIFFVPALSSGERIRIQTA